MEQLKVILENESVKQFMLENENNIHSALIKFLPKFYARTESYITEHIDEFLGETVEETYQNISDFARDKLVIMLEEMDNEDYDDEDMEEDIAEDGDEEDDYVWFKDTLIASGMLSEDMTDSQVAKKVDSLTEDKLQTAIDCFENEDLEDEEKVKKILSIFNSK